MNIARSAALGAGFPESVPAVTVDRQCGSSQQAAHFAAQGVMAGVYDIVIAAGVESMSRVPMWANAPDPSEPYGPRFRERYGLAPDFFIDQGESGEMMADRFELTREELDAFAVESHRRAAEATEAGRFRRRDPPGARGEGRRGVDGRRRRGDPARHDARAARRAARPSSATTAG